MSMKKKKHTKLFEWQQKCKQPGMKCKCGETRRLTVDHIVPVNILVQFGLDRDEVLYNMEENFEIMCSYCNLMKGGRIDPRNPRTYQIFDYVLLKSKKENIIQSD